LEERLNDRIYSYVRNIVLLYIFIEDVWADCKLQDLDQDFEKIVDIYIFGDQGGEDSIRMDDENIDSKDYYNTFLGVLSAVRGSEVDDILISSALKCLKKEAWAVDIR